MPSKKETTSQEQSLKIDLFNVLLVFALQQISVTRAQNYNDSLKLMTT